MGEGMGPRVPACSQLVVAERVGIAAWQSLGREQGSAGSSARTFNLFLIPGRFHRGAGEEILLRMRQRGAVSGVDRGAQTSQVG